MTLPTSAELLAQGKKQEPIQQAIVRAGEPDLQIAFRNETRNTVKANLFGQMIESQTDSLKKIMPKHMTIERLKEITVLQLKNTPALLKCELASLMQAVYQAGALGLEPYSVLGELYILPYGEKAQVIIGYKGLRKLVMNSGEVASINAHAVYEEEIKQGRFEYSQGIENVLKHSPLLSGDKGAFVGAYAVAKFKNPDIDPVVEYMSKEDIEHVKKSSASAGGKDSPWQKHYAEMARKTVIRRIIKQLPLSVIPDTLRKAQEIDNAQHESRPYHLDVESGEVYYDSPQPSQAELDFYVEGES
jgi:recombination protein RecT